MYIFMSNPSSIRSAQNPQGGDDVVLASVHEEEDVVAGLRGPRAGGSSAPAYRRSGPSRFYADRRLAYFTMHQMAWRPSVHLIFLPSS
jgi:hypothetical protein